MKVDNFPCLEKSPGNDKFITRELSQAGIPVRPASCLLDHELNISRFGFLGEWLFYRRSDYWVAMYLHRVCPWTKSKIHRVHNGRNCLAVPLAYPTEFQLLTPRQLKRFAKIVSPKPR